MSKKAARKPNATLLTFSNLVQSFPPRCRQEQLDGCHQFCAWHQGARSPWQPTPSKSTPSKCLHVIFLPQSRDESEKCDRLKNKVAAILCRVGSLGYEAHAYHRVRTTSTMYGLVQKSGSCDRCAGKRYFILVSLSLARSLSLALSGSFFGCHFFLQKGHATESVAGCDACRTQTCVEHGIH